MKTIQLLLFVSSIFLLSGTSYSKENVRTASIMYSDSQLTLEMCLRGARDNNAKLFRALANVKESRGETYITYSRLLPHLALVGGAGERHIFDTTAHENGRSRFDDDQLLSLELRQRVLEFGKSTDLDIIRIKNKLSNIYKYEEQIVQVLSEVRSSYFTIKLTDEQLQQHDSLFLYYTNQLERSKQRLENGIVLKTVMLAARLNRLEEQQRILALRARRHTQVAYLSELTGLGRISDNVQLTSTMTAVEAIEDSCVRMALDRSTDLTNAEAETHLAKRQFRQWLWEFAPTVALNAGVYNDKQSAAIQLFRSDTGHDWAVDAIGKQNLLKQNGFFYAKQDTTLKYTASIEFSFPLFAGFKRAGTFVKSQAHYEELRANLVAKTRSIETQSRAAYYDYDLARKNLDIQKERVEIARERYNLAETLHEIEKISEDGFDNFRAQLFEAQDRFYDQQFDVLAKGEHLRALIRQLE